MKKLFTLLIMAILATATSFAATKTGSWDLTTASDDWEATGNATYFSQPYGYKAANGTLTNSAISDFSTSGITQIKVGFKCLQNGGTTSKITIYLVNSEGTPLGDGVVVTPVNATAATKTEYQHATFTSGLTGATGFMMKVTTFGKNILVNGAEYEVTYSGGQEKTLTSLAVSGTPTKTTYNEGDTFNPAGLTVTGTYSDANPETITSGITWTFNPATLSAGQTSVGVTAKVGNVTSPSYTVNGLTVNGLTALTTMDEIFAAATTAGTTATDTKVTFNNWVVTGVKNSNAYVTDGTKGFIIYQANHGFEVGDVLSGTAYCKVQLYNGSSELTNLTSTTTGLTVTRGGTVTPQTIDIASLSGVNTGAVLKFSNVTYNGTAFSDGTNTITPYNTFMTLPTLASGVKYNVTGVFVQYNDKKEIAPRTSEDIEEVQAVKYNVTIADGIAHGTVSADVAEAPEGAEVTLTATPAEGYKFDAWDVKDASSNTIEVANNKFTMPAANVTVSATFVEKPATSTFVLVTNADQLAEGKKIVFVGKKGENFYSMGTKSDGNNRPGVLIEVENNEAYPSEDIQVFTLEATTKDGDAAWMFNDGNDKYIYAASSGSNYLKTANATTAGDNGKATIDVNPDGAAAVTFQGTNTRNSLKFNNSGSTALFSCYSTGQAPVYIYMSEEAPATKTLDHITLSGSYQTEFNVGDTFNHNGMTVTASYAEEGVADADVTKQATFSTPDMSQAGTQTVTVSYTEGEVTKTATYTITIKKKSARAYTLVTSQDDIVDGGEYIILSEDGNYAAAVGTNNRIETEARGENTYKIVDNTVIVSSYSVTRPYFLVATDNTDNTDKGWYLNDGEYNASITNNNNTPTHIDFVADKQDVFTVSIADDNTAQITAPLVDKNRQIAYHYWIKQNTTDVVERAFRYYASSNVGTANYQAIKLYKRVNTVVIEDGYRSRYNESTERNLYKNTLTYDVPKANDELKLYRGETLLGTFNVDATNENYTFTPENAFDADQTNRFDDEPVVLTGNADNGLTITDYYSEFIEANMPEAVRYSLRDADEVEVGIAVVPLYRSVASARVMMDPDNNVQGYTADDIVNDNAHAANYQNNVRVDVAHADIDGLSGIKVYRDHVVVGEADAAAEYVDVKRKEVRLSNIFESELAVTSAYGENTYGSPKATVHAALVSVVAHEKKMSTYTFTTADGKTGHYFSVLADVKLNQPENGEFELVGVRAWRDCNSSAEPIEQLAGRSNDYNYATILDTDNFTAIEGNEVKNIGSEVISYKDAAGTNFEFGSGVFGSSANLPTVSLRVRAYYRRAAQSSAAPMMKAPAAAGNYYVAEAFAEVTFTADVPTGVLDVAGAKEVKSVRYFNIMGVESAEPVDGVNIVVTTYTDGTSSSAKMLR
ncbi:MAG: bacterial Ig-like domain-containing protein [Muribaculaceae bacterium]|nr:bacterial Ig-like domain-containing protein [Muribaculaceae bacterium]